MKDRRFDDLMSAISFAEAGEHETARSLMRGRDTILLAVSDRFLDDAVLKYALNMSRRINAEIEVLYLSKNGQHAGRLARFVAEACQQGTGCELHQADGCMKKAILAYTAHRRNILFVVVGTTPELDIECTTAEKSVADAWKRLKCPLVVVAKGELPSPA